ncbi:MAG: hypothetical protein Q4E12_03710 [Coriobacteriia bacterium]|nr:hypothetical protein [Coriobacteriia bacterium]
MTEDQERELAGMGYTGEAAAAVAEAWSVEGAYGGCDMPPLICPASMCGTPRVCHGACVWCPFAFMRDADMTSEGRLGEILLGALRAVAAGVRA